MSPDLSPLDYRFCSVAMRELTRVSPSSIEEMKTIDSLDTEKLLKAVVNIRSALSKTEAIFSTCFTSTKLPSTEIIKYK